MLGAQAAVATDGNWLGTGDDREWNNSDNWNLGAIASGTGAKAYFQDAPANSSPIILPTSLTLGYVTFTSDDVGSQVIGEQSGPRINLDVSSGNAQITMDSDVVASQTINAPLHLWDNLEIINNSATANFTIGGVITRESSAGATRTVTLSGTNATGTNIFSGSITDTGTTLIIRNSGTWRLTGAGSQALTKAGVSGIVEVANDQAFGSMFEFNGGTLKTYGGARTFANNFQATANGKLVADHNVTINGYFAQAVDATTLTIEGDGQVVINGNIYISKNTSTQYTFTLSNSSKTTINGVIANANGGPGLSSNFSKSGTGTLILTGQNTYTGVTRLYDGVLEAKEGQGLGSGKLFFNTGGNGGVLQSSGSFSRTLTTTGTTGVQFLSSGGFAAKGGTFTINLNGGTTNVGWVPGTGNRLIFGSSTADSVVDFQNGIGLTTAQRTIQVNDNPLSTGDIARISGQITSTDSGGGLRKTGLGVLELTHADNTYTGSTVVEAGTLRVNGNLTGTSGVTLSAGAVLEGTGSIVSAVGGAGVIRPGNSPGTLSIAAVNPNDGLSFGFEFLGGSADILRLTSLFTPIAGNGSLTDSNTISLYLDTAAWDALSAGDPLTGGFYLDGGDFASAFENATFNAFLYNGTGYDLIRGWNFSIGFESDDRFASNGTVSYFTAEAVPEPGTWAMLAIGGAYLLVYARKRARRSQGVARAVQG